MIFVLLTTTIMAHPPFNVVQLLWINLIMDVLAAIAFSTENPHPTDIRKERVSVKDKIITKTMMRSILSQGVYQLVVMLILCFAGPKMFGIEYNFYQTPLKNDTGDSFRLIHQTLMFQCFVMMNLFNMINCRLVDPMPEDNAIDDSAIDDGQGAPVVKPEFNIFQRPFSNWWFWIIFFGELNVQFWMVGYEWTGTIFTTTPLTFGMHMTAIGLGLGAWGIAALIKLTGKKTVNFMPEMGEDQDALN